MDFKRSIVLLISALIAVSFVNGQTPDLVSYMSKIDDPFYKDKDIANYDLFRVEKIDIATCSNYCGVLWTCGGYSYWIERQLCYLKGDQVRSTHVFSSANSVGYRVGLKTYFYANGDLIPYGTKYSYDGKDSLSAWITPTSGTGPNTCIKAQTYTYHSAFSCALTCLSSEIPCTSWSISGSTCTICDAATGASQPVTVLSSNSNLVFPAAIPKRIASVTAGMGYMYPYQMPKHTVPYAWTYSTEHSNCEMQCADDANCGAWVYGQTLCGLMDYTTYLTPRDDLPGYEFGRDFALQYIPNGIFGTKTWPTRLGLTRLALLNYENPILVFKMDNSRDSFNSCDTLCSTYSGCAAYVFTVSREAGLKSSCTLHKLGAIPFRITTISSSTSFAKIMPQN